MGFAFWWLVAASRPPTIVGSQSAVISAMNLQRAAIWLAVGTGVESVAAAIGGVLGGVQELTPEWLLVMTVQAALVMRLVLQTAEMGY